MRREIQEEARTRTQRVLEAKKRDAASRIAVRHALPKHGPLAHAPPAPLFRPRRTSRSGRR